jgi:hypothetical protein
MNQHANNSGKSLLSELRSDGIDGRIFRSMMFATILAVIGSLALAQWRVSTGLLLGGVLSLVNHHWLSNSTKVALSVVAHGAKPRIGLAQYVLRYVVVAGVIFAGYQLDIVSLAATLVGLCSFVVALFVEAVREVYLAIIHREEIS